MYIYRLVIKSESDTAYIPTTSSYIITNLIECSKLLQKIISEISEKTGELFILTHKELNNIIDEIENSKEYKMRELLGGEYLSTYNLRRDLKWHGYFHSNCFISRHKI